MNVCCCRAEDDSARQQLTVASEGSLEAARRCDLVLCAFLFIATGNRTPKMLKITLIVPIYDRDGGDERDHLRSVKMTGEKGEGRRVSMLFQFIWAPEDGTFSLKTHLFIS